MAYDDKTYDAEGALTISRQEWERAAAEIAYLRFVEQNRRETDKKKRDDDQFTEEVTIISIYQEIKSFLSFMGFLEKIRDDAQALHEQIALQNFETKKFQERSDDYFRQIQQTVPQQPTITPAQIKTELTRLDTLIQKTEEKTIADWGSKDWQTGLEKQVNTMVKQLDDPFDNVLRNADPKDQATMQKAMQAAAPELKKATTQMQAEITEKFKQRKSPDQIQKVVAESLTAAAAAPIAPVHLGEEAPAAPPLAMNFSSIRQVASKAITDSELLIATSASALYKKFGDLVNPHGNKQFVKMGAEFAKGAVGALKGLHEKVENFHVNKVILDNLHKAKDQMHGLTASLEKSLHHSQTSTPRPSPSRR